MTGATKTARVETRTPPAKKARYQHAAAIRGLTFTEFIERSLDEAAKRAENELESIELTQHDANIFVEALLSAPEPDENLKSAARNCRQRAECLCRLNPRG